ncbi:hypothetical protein, partial [Halapricum sp. CBA1109]|uniref:hypothetical protein n=1 Tax=Halapricum sp. CBA1109 TaxID=2668068 RepID=UPI0018D2715A
PPRRSRAGAVLAGGALSGAGRDGLDAGGRDPGDAAGKRLCRPALPRPAADRWLRTGRRALALVPLLLALAVLAAPRPVVTFGPVVPLAWLPDGALGAPSYGRWCRAG